MEKALDALLGALTQRSRRLLTLPESHIDVGSECDVTWFHPEMPHAAHIGTKGVNLPPIRDGLRGQVLGVFKADRTWLASDQA